jgi:hypothetical protein
MDVYNKEKKKSEYQPNLHVDGKSDTKSQISRVQQIQNPKKGKFF